MSIAANNKNFAISGNSLRPFEIQKRLMINLKDYKLECVGKPEMARTLPWSVERKGSCSGRSERGKLSFPAPFVHFVHELALSGLRFFVTFFWRAKESKNRI
jgi:hypothetical protein